MNIENSFIILISVTRNGRSQKGVLRMTDGLKTRIIEVLDGVQDADLLDLVLRLLLAECEK